MSDSGPNRHIPREEYVFDAVEEEFLLQDPITNAGALCDIYQARAEILAERIRGGVDSLFSQLLETLDRLKFISKLLPDDDPRSYGAWKKEFNPPATEQIS